MVKLQLESSRQSIQRRLTWLYPITILIFALLGIRLWWLQILQGPAYERLAEQNRIRTIQVVAPRGPILDRNSVPLVENRPSFNILLDRETMKDPEATREFVTGQLGVDADDYEAQLRRSRRTGTYRPIVIKEDVGIEDVSIVESHRREHPEIQLGGEPKRLYRYGILAAHVLGYVGEVSEDDLANKVFPGVQSGDLVGRSGIERVYNQGLIGKDGTREVLVDSVGRELGVLAEKDAVIGGDLRLTLDFDLQARADALLDGSVGSIIMMDPRNGEILAMAASPSFNPNSFSSRISAEDWNALISDPNHPLQNRAIQNAYPPGSIFKLVIAQAGLDEKVVGADTHVVCRGAAVFYNRVFHCWKASGHGTMDLEAAIANSCNIFFYTLGQELGIDRISQHARALGLGQMTGVDLPGERSGVVPPSPGTRWYPGETISVAIGQGAVTATPLQVLRAVCAIATGGTLVTPHLLLRAEQGPVRTARCNTTKLPILPEDTNRIRAGMWASVNAGGTGHAAAIKGFDICGKTGTVQVIGAERRKEIGEDLPEIENHAWFAGFMNRDDPEVALVVFLEHGGGGGAAAAPIARSMFEAYVEKMGSEQAAVPLSARAPGGAGR